MANLLDFHGIGIVIQNGVISSLSDLETNTEVKSWPKAINQRDVQKLYVLKEGSDYLYVGATRQSVRARLYSGLRANGKSGYHGYRWKDKEKLSLFVWCFPNINTEQLENIEAELVYIIRNNTGRWPLSQSEIHFNNKYTDGHTIARELFASLSEK